MSLRVLSEDDILHQFRAEISAGAPASAVGWFHSDEDHAEVRAEGKIVGQSLLFLGSAEQGSKGVVLPVRDFVYRVNKRQLELQAHVLTRLHDAAEEFRVDAVLEVVDEGGGAAVKVVRVRMGEGSWTTGNKLFPERAEGTLEELLCTWSCSFNSIDPRSLKVRVADNELHASTWHERGLHGVSPDNVWFAQQSQILVRLLPARLTRESLRGPLKEASWYKPQFERTSVEVGSGIALVTGSDQSPLRSSRLPVVRAPLTVRSTPVLSTFSTGAKATSLLDWRVECEVSTARENEESSKQEDLWNSRIVSLWNSRIVNDLLRQNRVSFLPYFVGDPRDERAACDETPWHWVFVVIERPVPTGTGKAGASGDWTRFRALVPAQPNETSWRAEFQGAAHGLGEGEVPSASVSLMSIERPPDPRENGSPVPTLPEVLLEDLFLAPTSLAVEKWARLPAPGPELMSEAASKHGVMLFDLELTTQPTRIALDGVAFPLATNAGRVDPAACAWMSLAGEFEVGVPPTEREDPKVRGAQAAVDGERPRWKPSLSHYQIAKLRLPTSGFQALPSSARLNARRADGQGIMPDVARGVRSEARGVVAPVMATHSVLIGFVDVNEVSRRRGGVDVEVVWTRGPAEAPTDGSGRNEAKHATDLLLIQFQPLSVARVAAELGPSGTAGESKLGTYARGQWRFTGVRDFHAILPPSVMGEAVIRGSQNDPKANILAPFRFGPPTVLDLRSQDDPTAAAAAPWQLPEMLNGGENNEADGVGLRGLSAELLYGLSMRVSREGLRVASVFRRRGWPVTPPPSSASERAEFKQVGAVARSDQPDGTAADPFREWKLGAWSASSSVLGMEVFNPSADRQGSLRLDSGVAWRLRTTARLADPFAGAAGTDVFPQPQDGPNRGDPLWGGVTIGFESKGVLDEFKDRAPSGSTGGHLNGLTLSAHGATASFRSEFENGLLIIECTVEQGVVTRYVVSRKGRIGCLWNHARHVVVYERTAISNPRYTGRKDDRKQCPQEGRAFLRKVDEYIEVVQVRRGYPDLGHSAAASAFIAGSDFGAGETVVFRVEASWANDILDDTGSIVGWSVPLWLTREEQVARGAPDMESANAARSGIHPKPTISLLLNTNRADGGADHQLIEDPEKLVFYTRVFGPGEEPNADTDTWPPVCDIDYCDVPQPQPGQRLALSGGSSADSLDEHPNDGDDPLIAPGFEAFTLRLAPGGRPVNLMHGRRDEALVARVASVLICRAGLRNLGEGSVATDRVKEARDSLERVRNVCDLSQDGSELRAQLERLRQLGGAVGVGDFESAVKKLSDALAVAVPDVGTAAVEEVTKKFINYREGFVEAAGRAVSVRLAQFQRIAEKTGADSTAWVEQALLQPWPGLAALDRLVSAVSQAVQLLTSNRVYESLARVVEQVSRAIDTAKADIDAMLKAATLGAAARPLRPRVRAWSDSLEAQLQALGKEFDEIKLGCWQSLSEGGTSARMLGEVAKSFEVLLQELDTAWSDWWKGFVSQIRAAQSACDGVLAEFDAALQEELKEKGTRVEEARDKHFTPVFKESAKQLRSFVDAVSSFPLLRKDLISEALKPLLGGMPEAYTAFRKAVIASVAEVNSQLVSQVNGVNALIGKVARGPSPIAVPSEFKLDAAENMGDGLLAAVKAVFAAATKAREEMIDGMRAVLGDKIVAIPKEDAAAVLRTIAAVLIEDPNVKATTLSNLLTGAAPMPEVAKRAAMLKAECDRFKLRAEQIQYALRDGRLAATEAVERLRGEAQAACASVRGAAAACGTALARSARALEKRDVFALADGALSLHRAFGNPPRVPGLDFNRDQIGYHFDRIRSDLRTTPMGALLDRAGGQLKGISLRLPTEGFGDSFVPALRDQLDIGKIFPDIAGLKLSDLLPGVDLSRLSSEHVRVKHEFDPKTRTAAVFADIDYPISGERPLVKGDVLSIVLRGARLRARTRVETVDGVVRREAEGSLSADWLVKFGGADFVEFRETTLRFDASGKTKFDLRPEKLKLCGLLGFVSEKLKSLMPDGEVVRYLRDATGLPRGVEVNIDLPIPDVQGGTTGFSGLRLGARFALMMGEVASLLDPEGIKKALSEFEIGVGFSLAKPDRPFNLSAFILGGAGHLDIGIRYRPMQKMVRAYVDVSMNASASLAFAVAGVTGGVYAYLGIVFRYEGGTGMSPQLVFAARLLITGEVDVWGIVSASISIELRLAYIASRKKLAAAGRLKIRIKICWCFTIKISVGFRIPSDVSEAEMGMQALGGDNFGSRRSLALTADAFMRAAAMAT